MLVYIFMNILLSVVVILSLLVNVAFFTLLERKILGLSQSRKGPNKVSLAGLFQPLSDALKLFLKKTSAPLLANNSLYLSSPMLFILLSMFLWMTLIWANYESGLLYSVLLLLLLLSMNLYPLLLAGWFSGSLYSFMGAIRSIAQTVSYEISMSLFILSYMYATKTENWLQVISFNKTWFLGGGLFAVLVMIFLCFLAESNRTPFDFSESESELVSGFNIEYAGGLFTLIFMAEYSMILTLSSILAIMLISSNLSWQSFFVALLFASAWIWLRTTLPRYRYDKLMSLAWVSFLPLSLGYLFFFIGLI